MTASKPRKRAREVSFSRAEIERSFVLRHPYSIDSDIDRIEAEFASCRPVVLPRPARKRAGSARAALARVKP